MEVESAYRTLQYKHEQESEALRVSEALQSQLKEQISRSEEKLAKYVEVKICFSSALFWSEKEFRPRVFSCCFPMFNFPLWLLMIRLNFNSKGNEIFKYNVKSILLFVFYVVKLVTEFFVV